MEIRIYYEDTDCGGVVYYANYLRYFERARTQFFLDRKISPAEYQKRGFVFTVVSALVNYKSPAFYGDLLEAGVIIEGVKGSSFTVHYTLRRPKDDSLIATGSTRMACVNEAMKPVRMPSEIREALTLSIPRRKI
ncbi:MAG: acyl-CoA thioesterase [Nitrospinae bacterium]|nr:acyl-CoA thioesterase [Nitrospinota bacterium]